MNAQAQAQNKKKYLLWLVSAIGVYVVTFCLLKFRLFDTVRMGLRDLAIFDQAIWNLFRHGTLNSSLVGGNIMGEHTSLFLFLLAPFYLLHFGPKTLLFLEVLCVGLGALPVYFIARRVVKQHSTALFLAIAYLLYPATGFLTMDGIKYGFHLDAFLPLLYLCLIYFLITGRNLICLIFVLLTLSVKEDTALTVCLIGLYALVVLRKVRMGSAMVVLSVVWLFFAVNVVIPYFHGGPSRFFANYGYLGGTIPEAVWFCLSHPLETFRLLQEHGLFFYCVVLLAPFAFLSLLGPEILLLALPSLLLNLLSDPSKYEVPHSSVSWHIASLVPFIVVSALYGAVRLKGMLENKSGKYGMKQPHVVSRAPLFLLLTAVTASHLFYGASPLSLSFWGLRIYPLRGFSLFQRTNYQASGRESAVAAIRKIIPDEASVSATFYIGSHFSHRRDIFLFPERSDGADYVLVDREMAVNRAEVEHFVRQQGSQYKLVYNKGPVFLYEKSD